MNAATPAEALALLRRVTGLPGHEFWPDDLTLLNVFPASVLLATHQHVTDGYLLALAAAHEGILATLDRGISALAEQYSGNLEVIAA